MKSLVLSMSILVEADTGPASGIATTKEEYVKRSSLNL
jgi:hypothetical protein